jgi:hypothetical protein
VLDWRRRAGPLTVDALAAFVDEHRRIASARVQLGEIVGDDHAVDVRPRAAADPVAGVGRTAVLIVLDAR